MEIYITVTGLDITMMNKSHLRKKFNGTESMGAMSRAVYEISFQTPGNYSTRDRLKKDTLFEDCTYNRIYWKWFESVALG